MKKALVSLVLILGLTGCGEKSLTCTITETESDFEMSNQVIIKFNKDESIKGVNMVMNVVIPDEYSSYKTQFINSFKEQDSYKEIEENSTIVETDNGFKITVSGNTELIEGLTNDDDTISYDALKKAFTDEGYTCN